MRAYIKFSKGNGQEMHSWDGVISQDCTSSIDCITSTLILRIEAKGPEPDKEDSHVNACEVATMWCHGYRSFCELTVIDHSMGPGQISVMCCICFPL